ncbi:MAG: ATP-binding cassette domain-containing protein, partial [Deltaproteobacteria bacterium]|nr:ATP-binding cassette domain-containing protein [Deltaproteobacteria bacterium]
MDLIAVKDVSKSYMKGPETIDVLRDVSFQIRAGEMVSVIGASGAGKSTLLHVLGTLDAPDSGEIFYKGESLANLGGEGLADFRNESLGFVFQFH